MNYAKKSLGQNFLIDKNIIKKIVSLSDIKNKNVIEIGPGTGAITNEILEKKPKSLILIEKDNYLFKKLKNIYKEKKVVEVLNHDILKFNLEDKVKSNSIIFGNLPYNISSQILVKILKFKRWPPKFKEVIFMFQKELGEKITGKYLTSNYSRLSILTNYRLKVINKFLIKNNCFFPKPKINSVILHFEPIKKNLIKIKNINNLEKITNILFSNKRKMINKNIRKLFLDLKNVSFLNLNLRPSEISPEIYYKITNLYEKN